MYSMLRSMGLERLTLNFSSFSILVQRNYAQTSSPFSQFESVFFLPYQIIIFNFHIFEVKFVLNITQFYHNIVLLKGRNYATANLI